MSPKVRKALFPILKIAAGVILMLGSVAWFLDANGSGGDVQASAPTMRMPHPDIPRIGLGDAKAAFDVGTAVFIDTRGEPYFSQGHIPGALSITEDELPERLDEFNSSDWVITYCT